MSSDSFEFEEVTLPVGDDVRQGSGAPYMSYKGFLNLLTRFSEEGLPGRFDGSYFGNASGSLVAQVRGSMRFLDLIDEEKHPTDLLKTITEASEDERKQYLKMIFEEKYADALALSKNATAGQLAEVFRDRGLSGATVQKAITFFLGMADDVGVELSPHFKKGRVAASNGGSRKRRAAKTAPAAPTPAPTPHVVEPKVSSVEAQKAAYVNMLMDLATKDNADANSQQTLLDRIEKALGIGAPGAGGGPTDLP
ncbi:DUF5343 domain-containing protein [Nocardioides daphniae]|uniref:DUF5343 domain-containing protein n=1 Tax=Nocardioides daphniae TaxID=402297 RepID=A0A4V1CWB7_9ACTN|nr:DUF5343 domain-containing protein [Nocardioides daphniae]QCC76707.1 hypothetical protein E2C04_04785 [Nocardioides daphniae]GGD15540.1 hypothetical protein GCM10007231_13180 [Nocardioides daphniae]